jgi:2-polyprenyl-3-methyl-5-hydroxy-6-metoxy-1,4-benzoquinol methylase
METHQLGETFEVIVAGDVIEHMSNPGLFLDNCRRHLEPGGQLILTTPNAKWPTVFLRPNPTHALWHDHYTLRHLLERHHYHVTLLRTYPGNKPHYSLPKRCLAWHQGLLAIATPSDAEASER